MRAACAAARSAIRRRGFTVVAAHAAARACRAGAADGTYNRGAAAAWFAAEAVCLAVGWPGSSAGRPKRLALSLGTWSPGSGAVRQSLGPLPVAPRGAAPALNQADGTVVSAGWSRAAWLAALAAESEAA
jgi:hypothetical protein